ncbi:hypothetical protein HDU87_007259 [Geranomyces variabilis]|uniref:Uncharacterized protein n=1 Tax=Geranomyces variabilis TaxID=109894 RepID=A0AAD5TFA5_9FUNG|nr:hypothetical protein HDU87_007259 [Geranomyces variabilis]
MAPPAAPQQLLPTLVAAFRARETAHLRALPPADRALATCSNAHPLHDLAHAGEFALLLCGLKPAVLIAFPATGHPDNTPAQESAVCGLLKQYVDVVWRPAVADSGVITLQCIDWPLSSPHTPSLRGAWLAATISGAATVAHAMLHDSKVSGRVTERELALALGYPAVLPEREPDAENERYMQAAYTDAADGSLYTCFVARAEERPTVERHFAHCCRVLHDKLGVNLELHIQ